MTRNMTAARLRTAALHERLPVAFDRRCASVDPSLSAQTRLLCRMASRYVFGNVDSADYDIIARLQVLEGASGGRPGKHAGKWWKQGRRGLHAAQDHFKGTDIDPSWFSTGNTGMISKVLGMVRQEYNKWSRKREVHFSPDDIIQNGLMGLTKDGMGALAKGPYFFQFGAFNKGVASNIPKGKETPQGVAGIAAKFFVQNVGDEFKGGDRNRAPTEDAEGHSVFDSMSRDKGDFYKVLQDLLVDPRSGVRQLIQKSFEKSLKGEGKWADMATELFIAQLTGKKVKKQDMAAQYGMAPGTLSKVIRVKLTPAIADIQRDKQFLGQLRDIGERAMMRSAFKHLIKRASTSA